MSGGYVHVKFLVPCDKEITQTRWYDTIDVDLTQIGRDALINKCYDDGFRDGRRIAEEDSDADNS